MDNTATIKTAPLSDISVPVSASPIALERKKRVKKQKWGLTKRVALAIDYLIWGYELENVDIKRAAELAQISEKAFRTAITKPTVLKYYREQMHAIRNGERGNNLRTAIQIRDDKSLKASPTGQRVRLQAVQLLDQDIYTPTGGGVGSGNSVTVNVVSAGYVVDLREGPTGGQQIDHLDTHVSKPMKSLKDVSE